LEEKDKIVEIWITLQEKFKIAGYPRISVDEEIAMDKSGYTFEQRECYMKLRPFRQSIQ